MQLDNKIQELISNKDSTYLTLLNSLDSELQLKGKINCYNMTVIDILFYLLEQDFTQYNINLDLYKKLHHLLNTVNIFYLYNGTTQTTTTIPVLTVTPLLLEFDDTVVNAESTTKQITISGTNVEDIVTITSDSVFEISLRPFTDFSTKKILIPVNSIIATIILYVKFLPIAIADYDKNVTFNTLHMTDIDVQCTGAGIAATP